MLERLWSYLGLFRKMTKEMSSTHREDVLSDALFYLAKKLKSRIGRITTTVPHNKVINTFTKYAFLFQATINKIKIIIMF